MGVELPIAVTLRLADDQYDGLIEALNKLTSAVLALKPKYHFEGGGFMRSYAGDRPPDTTSFTEPTVVDSEQTPLDPQPDLTYTFSSDKPEICDITDNGDGTVTTTYGTPVKLPDGSYDMATLKAESNEISLPDGSTLKDVKTEQVQLLPGMAAGFVGGGFNLPEA